MSSLAEAIVIYDSDEEHAPPAPQPPPLPAAASPPASPLLAAVSDDEPEEVPESEEEPQEEQDAAPGSDTSSGETVPGSVLYGTAASDTEEVDSDDHTLPPHSPVPVPTTVATPVLAPTLPPSSPSHTHRSHPGGSRMRRTPCKRVRNPHPICPDISDEPAPKRRKASARRPSFLTDALLEWRKEECLPPTFEVGESSHPPPSLPLTGEPMEETIPLLVARLVKHDDQILGQAGKVETLRGKIQEVEDSLYLTDQAQDTIHVTIETVQDRARDTGDRVTELERQMIELRQMAVNAERRASAFEHRAITAEQRATSALRQVEDLEGRLDIVHDWIQNANHTFQETHDNLEGTQGVVEAMDDRVTTLELQTEQQVVTAEQRAASQRGDLETLAETCTLLSSAMERMLTLLP